MDNIYRTMGEAEDRAEELNALDFAHLVQAYEIMFPEIQDLTLTSHRLDSWSGKWGVEEIEVVARGEEGDYTIDGEVDQMNPEQPPEWLLDLPPPVRREILRELMLIGLRACIIASEDNMDLRGRWRRD
jgi:hypothetical protein